MIRSRMPYPDIIVRAEQDVFKVGADMVSQHIKDITVQLHGACDPALRVEKPATFGRMQENAQESLAKR